MSQSTKYGKPKFDEYWRSRARSGAKGSVAILSFVGGVYGAKGWRLVGSVPELRQLTLLASSYPGLFYSLSYPGMKIDFLANGTDSTMALTGQVDGWGKPPPN